MDINDHVATHPVLFSVRASQPRVPQVVTLRAYEVYRKLYGEQEALVTGDCRGGFGVNELVAFLYAYPFPTEEWRQRVDEALTGMRGV